MENIKNKLKSYLVNMLLVTFYGLRHAPLHDAHYLLHDLHDDPDYHRDDYRYDDNDCDNDHDNLFPPKWYKQSLFQTKRRNKIQDLPNQQHLALAFEYFDY
jgi:hypothetical protein